MPFTLGDVVPLGVQTRDPNNGNVLTNASNVSLTVTFVDPSGTVNTVSPIINNPSVGQYQADYLTTQAGLHAVQWHASGVMTSAYSDVFDVRPSVPGYIVSLTDAKKYLNIATTTNDEELRSFIEAATAIVEDVVGPVVVRTITEVHTRPSHVLVLHQPPVVSLVSMSSVLLNATSYDLSTMDLDPVTGILRRIDGTPISWRRAGASPVRIVYTAGRPVVPTAVTMAARVIIDHLWETQRGHTQGARPSPGGGRATQKKGPPPDLPPRARELLRPYRRAPAIF